MLSHFIIVCEDNGDRRWPIQIITIAINTHNDIQKISHLSECKDLYDHIWCDHNLYLRIFIGHRLRFIEIAHHWVNLI